MRTTTIRCATCGDDLVLDVDHYDHTDPGIAAACADARGDQPVVPVITIENVR